LITVYLEGELAEEFISEIKLDVSSVAEAVQALHANFPHFRAYLRNLIARGIDFTVRVGNRDIGEDFLRSPISAKVCSIRIVPVPSGEGGGIGQILLGVALIGLALTGVGLLGVAPATFGLMGGLLVVKGLMSLVFGKVDEPLKDEENGRKSLIWNQPQQTITEGGRMPRLYGRHRIGHYIITGSMRNYPTVDGDDDDDE